MTRTQMGRPCPACLKHPLVCVCAEVRPISTPVRLFIYQHPFEVYRPSATARLVTLAVPSATLFLKDLASDERALKEALGAPGTRAYLVFPDPNAPSPAALREAGAFERQPPTFVLLDGSWRQVRRMRRRVSLAFGLPVVSLHPSQASIYRIRRQTSAQHLSTLEAAALLLAEAEGDAAKFQPMLELLDLMVSRIFALRGRDRAGRPVPREGSRQSIRRKTCTKAPGSGPE